MAANHYLRLLIAAAILSTFANERSPADEPTAEGLPGPIKKPAELKFKHDSFTFVRVKYTSQGRLAGASGRWATDYPDSDRNLSARFAKDTGLKIDPEGKVLTLTDPSLKQHPFIYLVEPGLMQLDDAEVRSLRDYLLGGGFLMVDDFWGESEWNNFYKNIKRVFPDREPTELPLEHEIFHCFYDLKEKAQMPSIHGWASGRTSERWDAKDPHYKGLFDDKGRLMAIICHNTDVGDGWETGEDNPNYFREISQKKSFPLGVNVVIYALTH